MKFNLVFLFVIITHFYTLAQVGIGTVDIHPSAQMEVKSNNRGFLVPRMTANQKNSIQNPAEGLTLYCTNCCENGNLLFHNGITWIPAVGCPDYDLDLDGVPNVLDLDDDNDGILDINEGSETPITSSPTSLSNITPGMNNNDLDLGDVMVFNNFISNIGGNPVDLRAECVVKDANDSNDKSKLNLIGGKPALGYDNYNWKQHANFVIKFTFVESGSVTVGNLTGTPIDVPSVQVIFSDIESAGSQNVSEMGGFGESYLANGLSVSPSELTVPNASDTWIKYNDNFRFGNSPRPSYPEYNLINVDRSYSGSSSNWNNEGTIGSSSNRGTAIIKYDTLSTIDLLFGVTGSSNGQANRGAVMVIASTFELNTSGGNVNNLKNSDSDGDGCFDVLEGGAGFTENQIDQSGKLLGAVDANGVPVIAGANGQSAGTSTDSGNNPCQ